jgi:excisionase family DNA binding protein
MEARDYANRTYLSAIEAAKFLGVSVRTLHRLTAEGILPASVAASGQKRFRLSDLEDFKREHAWETHTKRSEAPECFTLTLGGVTQRIYVKNAQQMTELADDSVHLVVTSPPYFNTKMYAREPIEGDLGNIHSLEAWLEQIGVVWREVYRVLQPGRKAFINIMNLPIRMGDGNFRTLNLMGKTIDLCEQIGFIFKRDIVWHKTNSVRAHFGTYPYPGGILINHMHEFILEFEKPEPKGYKKYAHLTDAQREESKLDKAFWISLKKSDVWVMKPEGSGDRRSHVAPFPYELPYRLIKAFSFVGETVLDPFVGSGTTLLACVDLRRNGVGYEINPEIALEAVQRLRNHQMSLLEGSE